MKKKVVIVATILVLCCGLLLGVAPDTLSLIFVVTMTGLIVAGFVMGLFPIMMMESAFKNARDNIDQALEVQTTSSWLVVQKMSPFFRYKTLDNLFVEYKNKVTKEEKSGDMLTDIEDVISQDAISLRTWQGFLAQVPGTLTGLGLLGTFIGLILGISSIGLSSVEAALESVETLLGGIELAFYSSIAGVILSIVFNISNRIVWNTMLREYGLFLEDFHKRVIPSIEDQRRVRHDQNMKAIIERLDRIPQDAGVSFVGGNVTASPLSEQVLMPQIRDGLKNGEFTFYLQPRVDMNTKKIVAAEALVRWNHGRLGTLLPVAFVPILEQNGFITKLDKFIWEEVCMTIRGWIDAGIRPVPVSVNISKTDIMAMDVPEFFGSMLKKYKIPPRCLIIEINRNSYISNKDATEEVEGALLQMGFKVIMDAFDGDYVSLDNLDNVKADMLKLDLSTMREKTDENMQNIFEQARMLQVKLIVKGIENTEQVSAFRKLGCQEGQGYYFYKPMKIEEFENVTR